MRKKIRKIFLLVVTTHSHTEKKVNDDETDKANVTWTDLNTLNQKYVLLISKVPHSRAECWTAFDQTTEKNVFWCLLKIERCTRDGSYWFSFLQLPLLIGLFAKKFYDTKRLSSFLGRFFRLFKNTSEARRRVENALVRVFINR